MFRRYMPKDRGMLFDFATPEIATMWMENTYLPLDMLFIRTNGTVARIETNAEPLSRRVISAGEPVLGVLELNGGICDELGNQGRRQGSISPIQGPLSRRLMTAGSLPVA